MSEKTDKNVSSDNTNSAPLPFPSPLQRSKSKLREEVAKNWDQVRIKLRKDLRAAKVDPFFIAGLGKILSEEDLQKLRSGLAPEEISSLNKHLLDSPSHPLDENSINKISLELKKVYINSPGNLDPETSVILEGLTSKQIMEFLSDNPKHTSVVFENLSPTKIGTLLNGLNADETEEFFLKAKNGEQSDPVSFEKDLASFKAPSKSPFRASLSMAVKKLSPVKEKAVFDGMIERGDLEAARELAQESFPSFLVINLPKTLLEEPLKSITAEDHASFLVGLENGEKEKWMDLIAPEGTKLKEMLLMEIETIEGSPEKSKQTLAMREEIQKGFYMKIKTAISSEKHTQSKNEAVKDWIEAQS